MPRKTTAQLEKEIEEELAKARKVWAGNSSRQSSLPNPAALDDNQLKKLGLCIYYGKPTRKGSALIDGWSAHKSCLTEYEDR